MGEVKDKFHLSVGAGRGILAFSGAKRQTIINRLFCLTCFPVVFLRKAKRSLSFATPTLEPLF
jgi:hypothetical protein